MVQAVSDRSLLVRKKILFIFGCLDLGGAERQGLMLARYLRDEHDADVEVMGFGESGTLLDMCRDAGITARGIPFPRLERFIIMPTRASLRLMGGFLSAVRAAQPYVLMPYTLHPNTWCGLLQALTGASECIWNQRDEGLGFTNGLLERLAIRRTRHFIANSEGGRSFLMRQGVKEGKILVIHNGIRLESPKKNPQQWRESLGVDDRTFLVAMIANLSSMKDHETLVLAWAEVQKGLEHGKKGTLVLAGRFDNRTDHIRGLIRELQLDDSVLLPGVVDDIAGLLGTVDLVVHSSESEGLPNSILEAMSAGCLVVGSDIPGIRLALGEENRRFLVEPKNSHKLAGAILEVALDSGRFLSYKKMNRERVERLYGFNVMGARYADFLGSLV